MPASTRKTIAALNKLVSTCKDGQVGYGLATDEMEESGLKDVFAAAARQRTEFATELLAEVHRLDVAEQRRGTRSGALHRCWMKMKKLFTRRPACTVVAECERGELAAVKAYEDALKQHLPDEARTILQRQIAKVKESEQRLHALRVLETLHALETACRNGDKGYSMAAQAAPTAELAEFSRLAEERGRFAFELMNEIHRLGDPTELGGTFAGLMHRGWLCTKAAFTLRKPAGILAECARGERAALKVYEEAILKELPAEIRALVERQYATIKADRDRMEAMVAEYAKR